jgi:hypothetical protein
MAVATSDELEYLSDSEALSGQAERWFITDSTRTARLVNLSRGSGDAAMDPDDISTIGSLFVEMLDA